MEEGFGAGRDAADNISSGIGADSPAAASAGAESGCPTRLFAASSHQIGGRAPSHCDQLARQPGTNTSGNQASRHVGIRISSGRTTSSKPAGRDFQRYVPGYPRGTPNYSRLAPLPVGPVGPDPSDSRLDQQASENGLILFATRVECIDDLFDKDAEIHVYRIVQEAVTNVVKHSTATEATVVIKKQPAAISISIRDNGRGFDLEKLSSQPHNFGYGLSGIAERVRIRTGLVVIDSRPGAGTSLAVEVAFKIS